VEDWRRSPVIASSDSQNLIQREIGVCPSGNTMTSWKTRQTAGLSTLPLLSELAQANDNNVGECDDIIQICDIVSKRNNFG
jgi:hypothetical protein